MVIPEPVAVLLDDVTVPELPAAVDALLCTAAVSVAPFPDSHSKFSKFASIRLSI